MILRIRQIAFNIAFYGVMIFFCFALMPTMLLPRKAFVKCLNFYFYCSYLTERYVLGLDYEIRGLENQPKSGAYFVAAKHYSAYETFKLNLLFKDAAIIMKKELQYIPMWGWLAMRAQMIFVERGASKGVQTLLDGARRVEKEGRAITIFPQGTRVPVDSTTDKYPYKRGLIRMYEVTNMPIMPMATNSGLFWSKQSIWKQPGKVVFEYLPIIPAGLPSEDVLKMVEERIETASARLIAEERNKRKSVA